MLKRAVVAAMCLLWLPSKSSAEEGDTSNASIRDKKTFGAAALYTPASDFILQYGAGGTYNLDAQIQLGFNFLMGSESTPEAEPDKNSLQLTKSDLSGTAFYGYGRYFFSDTFNVKGGLGYRAATIAYQIDDTVTGAYIRGEVSVSSVIMPVGLGNHWAWDSGLSVGVDWVTYMIALSGSTSASTETTFEVVDGGVEDLNDIVLAEGDKLAHSSTFTLALISLGYAF